MTHPNSDINLASRIASLPYAYGYSEELYRKTFHKFKPGHWKYRGFNFAVWDKINDKWIVVEK